MRSLKPDFLVNMFKGLVYLQVSSEEVPQGELRSQVLVNSAHCIHGSPPLPNNGDFCNAGNKRYYEGESWIDEDDKCISCTCKVTWRELLLTKNRDIFRGYSQEFLMGVWRPVLQITTPSVIKKRRFSTPALLLDLTISICVYGHGFWKLYAVCEPISLFKLSQLLLKYFFVI